MYVSKTLKFACNIGTMFAESTPLVKRLQQATSAGFSAVEIAFPYSWSLEEWREALTACPMQVVLINTPLGPNKEPGLAASNNRDADFIAGIKLGVKYCRALNCEQLHIMAGNEPSYLGQEEVFLNRMRLASGVLKEHGLCGLIETISPGVIPGYYLNDPRKTLQQVEDIACDNIFFQFDVFHLNSLGETDGQVKELFDKNMQLIRHVQVAQTPSRNEVNAEGGVDYEQIFEHFVSRKYHGFVGLEYKPSCDPFSKKTLSFLSKF